MKTKTHIILVLTLSVIVSTVICVITVSSRPKRELRTRVFRVAGGWGYDILVDKRILIHQETVPVWQKQQVFLKRDDAEKTAALVMEKLKRGQSPTLTRSDLENIIPVHPGEINK